VKISIFFFIPISDYDYSSSDMNIQSVTHDSIEDARTALKLYQKHKALMADGAEKWRDALNDLYEQGRKLQWKMPDVDEQ
jgi:PAB-dependent poly(A)-specific ribonuclease subunit 2